MWQRHRDLVDPPDDWLGEGHTLSHWAAGDLLCPECGGTGYVTHQYTVQTYMAPRGYVLRCTRCAGFQRLRRFDFIRPTALRCVSGAL